MRLPTKISFPQPRNWRRAAAWILGGLAASLLGITPLRAQEAQYEGQRVGEVRIVDEGGKNITEKTPPIPLEAGKTFDFGAERDSVRVLYRTGDYSDIRVTAAPDPGGLRVAFVVRRNYYNNVVRIVGLKEPPTEPAALGALRLGLGEPFRESSLNEAVERLKEALHDDGLYLAKVTWSLDAHEDTRQMDITVTVDPGLRAHVGDLVVKNETTYPDQELTRRARITSKNEMTQARLLRGAQRLKKYLVNQGYLGASAVLTPGTYDAAANRVPVTLAVTGGPRVRVEVNGAHLREGKLRKLLPIYEEGAVDEDLVQEGRRNIRDYFQREGYFNVDVQVNSHEDTQQNVRVVSFEISRGDRFKVAGVKFDGNKYFSDKLLLARLLIQSASFASSGRFSQQLMRGDADSIRGLYTSNGFEDAQVTPDVNDNYQGKKGSLFVAFHIVEGTQTRVAGLEINGNHALSKDVLLAVAGSTTGQPYSEADIVSDRNNILAMYFNQGFPEARFTDEVVRGETPNRVRLIYQITEGTQIDVSKVLLTGYQFTRPGIIAREVQIKEGGPLREGDVVETQRQLYNLGVFNRVQIAPQNPNGTDPDKVMVVETEEGKRYTIGYGFGFEVQRIAANCTSSAPGQPTTCSPNSTKIAASPRGIFEISRANMFGRAQTLSFKVRASTLEYRSVIAYTADHLFAQKNLSFQITGFADKSQDVNTFTSTRFEGSLQVIKAFSHSSSLSARYFYRRVKASDINETINVEQIPLFSLPTLVSGVGVNYARDHRDNPVDATRGTFNTVDLSVAADALGSSASFFRGYYQNSSFHTIGRAFVFARSVRFGIEEPFGRTTEGVSTECNSSEPISEEIIPLPERFFAGGGTSLRGFGLNQAGPRDPCTGFPIGGLAVLEFNQELRFPMKLPIIGNRLGGTIFYDGGNVYSDVNHISFAWKSPSPTDLNYFSHTVGFGVRYPTPVGPVRVDFGFQLNPGEYEATIQSPQMRHERAMFRLPRFQFFFNIGPVF
jgi:outer membrane protein insertion porin family